MSHAVIIIKPPGGGGFAASTETGELTYEVKYTPSHDTPLAEQNQRIAKMRRLLARVEATATGAPDPGD